MPHKQRRYQRMGRLQHFHSARKMSSPEISEATVIVVEDEDSTRESLDILINSAGYRCMNFDSGEAFLAQSLPHAPRCLLLDMRLGDQNGLEIQNELNARQAPLPVVFVSGDDSIDRAVSAMRAGAMDFLQKPFDPELLLKRVEQALQTSLDGHNGHQSAGHDAALLTELTLREHEILTLLVDGYSNKEAARILDITTHAVEAHRARIMEKLETHTLAELVRVWLNGESETRLPVG